MTEQEAIAYIERYTWSKTRLGLDRTRALLHALGDPQRGLRFVHVAGSNGKGSTCAMLDSILRAAGYRVGLYTSPYIEAFAERIRVNGENIPGARLASVTERVAAAADAMDDHPSQFELVTAAALLYFREERCDIVVLEVGMGGALDSTNVVDAPEVAVITNLGLEHTEYLGGTLAEIAAAKAGIVKPGCACVCYDAAPDALAVVRAVCAERGAPLTVASNDRVVPGKSTLDGQRFSYAGRTYRLALLGAHQLRNAAVVLETVRALRARGWTVPEDAVTRGLETVVWPARLEILCRKPLCVLDGGHNPQCAEALAETLPALLPGRGAVFVAGMLRDKDWRRVMALIRPFAERFVCLTPHSDRALPAEELAAWLAENGAEAEAAADERTALDRALSYAGPSGAVVAFGSLYMAGALRSEFPAALKRWFRAEKLAARRALTPVERAERSARLVCHILESEAYRNARTVMLYSAVRDEASLDGLIGAAADKRLCWPVCVSGTQMRAMRPVDGAWRTGRLGIQEPDPACAEVIPPEEIDLVICPCASFDAQGTRLGMGAGYYDRFLPLCTGATIALAAFEVQRAEALPAARWDVPVPLIITENGAFRTEAR